jgi:hypothetical protein
MVCRNLVQFGSDSAHQVFAGGLVTLCETAQEQSKFLRIIIFHLDPPPGFKLSDHCRIFELAPVVWCGVRSPVLPSPESWALTRFGAPFLVELRFLG